MKTDPGIAAAQATFQTTLEAWWQDFVAAARAKIDRDEARRVILHRMHRLLIETYAGYLCADQRACLSALENLHAKYAVTAQTIES